MNEAERMNEHINAIKEQLLANLDAQLQLMRYRYAVNTVLMPPSIEGELAPIVRILEQITALHKVAGTLGELRQHGVNRPLQR